MLLRLALLAAVAASLPSNCPSKADLITDLRSKMQTVTEQVARKGVDYGSGWTPSFVRIFSQRPVADQTFTKAEALVDGSPQDESFSLLSQLRAIHTGAKYHMRLSWPEAGMGLEWKQNENPLEVAYNFATGVEVTAYDLNGQSPGNFVGLGTTPGNAPCLLAGGFADSTYRYCVAGSDLTVMWGGHVLVGTGAGKSTVELSIMH